MIGGFVSDQFTKLIKDGSVKVIKFINKETKDTYFFDSQSKYTIKTENGYQKIRSAEFRKTEEPSSPQELTAISMKNYDVSGIVHFERISQFEDPPSKDVILNILKDNDYARNTDEYYSNQVSEALTLYNLYMKSNPIMSKYKCLVASIAYVVEPAAKTIIPSSDGGSKYKSKKPQKRSSGHCTIKNRRLKR